jgi:hypothetical protein
LHRQCEAWLRSLACADDRSRYNAGVGENEQKTLSCGCVVSTYRDFLGRVVGTILTRGEQCVRSEHQPDQVVIMPGREHARPE